MDEITTKVMEWEDAYTPKSIKPTSKILYIVFKKTVSHRAKHSGKLEVLAVATTEDLAVRVIRNDMYELHVLNYEGPTIYGYKGIDDIKARKMGNLYMEGIEDHGNPGGDPEPHSELRTWWIEEHIRVESEADVDALKTEFGDNKDKGKGKGGDNENEGTMGQGAGGLGGASGAQTKGTAKCGLGRCI
ncbi:hypothetical protein K491DRAFT_716192 [Lophiostoma macrostomum CBS 122681]|uniref:Uncharacterized protein n=1 Tax=Lophiostoma macrostomum CBS 122681 TaxID=1314788 RepID=A0A6A6T990_9PLEO|nr:hypothetical protein K491DRAFT_716192 [Lophiostoma macrostomum CBS 122681]